MASNFYMFSYKTRDGLHLKLQGDFDGTSAYELLAALKKYGKDFHQIFIDTNELKNIYSFGRQVFQKKLGRFTAQSGHLIFIGENGNKIAPNQME